MKKDYQRVWSECLDLIKERVTPRTFATWFQPIQAVGLQNDVLTIQVKSQYVYECLEEHYVDILRMAIRTVIGVGARLEYSVVVEESQKGQPSSVTISSIPQKKVKENVVRVEKVAPKNPFDLNHNRLEIDPQLNPSYTLDCFVEGSCNRLAKSAAMAIAQNPGKTAFNP